MEVVMAWYIPKMFTRAKVAVKPVNLDPIPVELPDEGFLDGDFETNFTESAPEIYSARHDLRMAAHDAKDTIFNLAKLVFHTAKLVFHTVQTAVQLAMNGLQGTYNHPEPLSAAAQDLVDMVKDAAHVFDGAIATATDLATAAGKGLVTVATAAAPYIASGAQNFANAAANLGMMAVNSLTAKKEEEEDEGLEIDEFHYDTELLGPREEDTIFDQPDIKLTGAGPSVFGTDETDL
jgi:hypothetical protein